MYAIIKTGGKQYKVTEGAQIAVEKLDAKAGEKVAFEEVLVMGEGADIKIGTPFLEGTKVFGEVVENGKGEKVIIFKYKAKKDYRKKQGHRQPYTLVEITGIGTDKPKKAAPKKEEPNTEAPKEEIKTETKEVLEINLAMMKKDELVEYAASKSIEIDTKATKAVIIEAIEAANK